MKPENMPKADFVVGLILMAFGLSIVIHALQMPRFENMGANPFSVPGIVPGILGTIIFCLSLAVFVRAFRNGGHRLGWNREVISRFVRSASQQRMLLTIAICTVYGLGLVGRINYYLATFLFVLAFLCLFLVRPGSESASRGRLMAVSVVQALVTAGVVGAVFRYVFLVDLP